MESRLGNSATRITATRSMAGPDFSRGARVLYREPMGLRPSATRGVGRAVPAEMRLDLMESVGFLTAAVRRAEPDLRKIGFHNEN
jgi:hypothetical protein